jgi:cysteine desulfuration protein SufE
MILPELAIFANAVSLVPAAFSFSPAETGFNRGHLALYAGLNRKDGHGMASIDQIIEDFSYLEEWEDRYRYVIELGKALPDLPDSEKSADNKVQGCASQVWLVSHKGDGADPVMTFDGDSDAHIVRGLVAIVLAIYSGRRASDIVATDAIDTFNQIGLVEHLSSQRANGLRSMIKRIRAEAAQAAG